MLFHAVYFWLKPELSDAQRADFRRGLESLRPIETVKSLRIGVPAAVVHRPVIENTYSFALVAEFADVAGHDAYQIDPVHKAFVETFRSCWSKVVIYDSQVG